MCTTHACIHTYPHTYARLLQQQGFGTRKECSKLIEEGFFRVNDEEISDPSFAVEVFDGLKFGLGDEDFEYRYIYPICGVRVHT
jgi:hypothetical protein